MKIICPECGSLNTGTRGLTGSGAQRYQCKNCQRRFTENTADIEIVTENVRLAKGKQKLQDLNRIQNKSFREFARLDNTLLEANEKLREVIAKNSFKIKLPKSKSSKSDVAMIVQLSDLHFNELVNLPHNKYDFQIAGKRLKKFADKIKAESKLYNVKKIFIAMTGDLMNSDRRLDEMLNQATNRNNATYLSYLLLSQFIVDINDIAEITIAGISGNESRAKQEPGYSDIIATDNYDFTIFNMLKVGLPGITFIEGDPLELVVNVNGINVLLVHGQGLETDTQKKIQQIMGKYSVRGVDIGFVVYGHLHTPYLTDYSARSGSLVGSNDYNEKALFLVSKASQNIHLIFKDKSIDSKKIDLQFTDEIKGYEIIKALESYNTKSAKKLHHKEIIHEIVI